MKDVDLTLRLDQKLGLLLNNFLLAAQCKIPVQDVETKGEQIKIMAQVLAACKNVDGVRYVMPFRTKNSDSGLNLTGGALLPLHTGLYKNPVVVLDFNRLYPSIMCAKNICYTTLIFDPASKVDCWTSPVGSKFVTAGIKMGVLARLLRFLIDARVSAKKEMYSTKEPYMRDVANARQLALKISANAVTGLAGAKWGRLFCPEVFCSVTSEGRELLNFAAKMSASMGKVIYGDTDSCMVDFGVDTLVQARKRAIELEEIINSALQPPLRIEHEKTLFPSLFIEKKTYCGVEYDPLTEIAVDGKMCYRNIHRRNLCPLVSRIMDGVIRILLYEQNSYKAMGIVREGLTNLLNDWWEPGDLVLTSSITRPVEDYKTKCAHTELYKKQNPKGGIGILLGNRISYIMRAGYEPHNKRAVDPYDMVIQKIPPDLRFYKAQLQTAVSRILKPIVGPDIITLFEVPLPVAIFCEIGPIDKFFSEKSPRCLGCKVVGSELCSSCLIERGAELSKNTKHNMDRVDKRLKELLQKCKSCITDGTTCRSKICPVVLARTKLVNKKRDLLNKYELFQKSSYPTMFDQKGDQEDTGMSMSI